MSRVEVVLNFHGIGSPGPHIPPEEIPYWLPVEQFEAVIGVVRRRSDIPVRLTFDDGNASDLMLALPILRRAGLRADFFILTDRLGASEYLSESDIKTLRDEGMAIGSHGTAHVPWTSYSRAALLKQVSEANARLSRILGTQVREVAVPFGAYDRNVVQTLRGCSVSRVYTCDGGSAAVGAWLVPRTTIRADTEISSIAEMVRNRFPLRRRIRAALRSWSVQFPDVIRRPAL